MVDPIRLNVPRTIEPVWRNPGRQPLTRMCTRVQTAAFGIVQRMIQFLLGHVSIRTTERYLGCKQLIRGAVTDRIGIEPKS